MRSKPVQKKKGHVVSGRNKKKERPKLKAEEEKKE